MVRSLVRGGVLLIAALPVIALICSALPGFDVYESSSMG